LAKGRTPSLNKSEVYFVEENLYFFL
jgi:hypothetical protein